MFLVSAIRALKLGGARVAEGRVESLKDELHGRLDAVVMRCAGDVEAMIPAAAALVAEPGIVIASGPPKPRPLSMGEWATVPGVKAGSTRRFAVYRRPAVTPARPN